MMKIATSPTERNINEYLPQIHDFFMVKNSVRLHQCSKYTVMMLCVWELNQELCVSVTAIQPFVIYENYINYDVNLLSL
jgi:hypothetical protein